MLCSHLFFTTIDPVRDIMELVQRRKMGNWTEKDICSSVVPSETADTACQYSSAHLPQIVPFK